MIYLDHNATTPVLPEPRRGFYIRPSSFSEEWGNPGMGSNRRPAFSLIRLW